MANMTTLNITTTLAAVVEEEADDDDIVKMTLSVQIPSGIGLAVLIILAVAGNVLTILAYITDYKLHTVYNFYILNLAITDLLLSCVSMPFYTVYTLAEFTWPFGMVFCKFWLVMDFTLCFESILLMLILSFDRLFLILLGPRYSTKITMKVALAQIIVSWLISFLIYSPAIIVWDHWAGYSTVDHNDCDVEFAYHVAYTTATAFIEFILPFVILVLLNTVIYYKIRIRNRTTPLLPSPANPATNNVVNGLKTISPDVRTEEVGNGSNDKGNDAYTVKTRNKCNGMNTERTGNGGRKKILDRRDNKAARLLAILVVAFLIFWAPYTITTVVISFCDECINTSLYEFFNWVLWMKSALNPLLYAYNSVQYRTNFRKLLTCNRRTHPETSDMSGTRNTNL